MGDPEANYDLTTQQLIAENDDSGTTHYAYGAVHMKSPILVIYIPRPLDSTGDVENLNTFRHPSRKPVHRFPCLRGIITPLWPLIAPSSSGRACNGTCVGFLEHRSGGQGQMNRSNRMRSSICWASLDSISPMPSCKARQCRSDQLH